VTRLASVKSGDEMMESVLRPGRPFNRLEAAKASRAASVWRYKASASNLTRRIRIVLLHPSEDWFLDHRTCFLDLAHGYRGALACLALVGDPSDIAE